MGTTVGQIRRRGCSDSRESVNSWLAEIPKYRVLYVEIRELIKFVEMLSAGTHNDASVTIVRLNNELTMISGSVNLLST